MLLRVEEGGRSKGSVTLMSSVVTTQSEALIVWLMDDVTQTCCVRLLKCRSAMVEKRPGRDGPGEIFALCSSPNKPQSEFSARPGAYPN